MKKKVNEEEGGARRYGREATAAWWLRVRLRVRSFVTRAAELAESEGDQRVRVEAL